MIFLHLKLKLSDFAKKTIADYGAYMDSWQNLLNIPENGSALVLTLLVIKRLVAFIGVIIISWGAISAAIQFLRNFPKKNKQLSIIDMIRLKFGKTIILGLEFIVAADIIETTTAPDYYSVGILASLVGIRTFLTYFMNRELGYLSSQTRK